MPPPTPRPPARRVRGRASGRRLPGRRGRWPRRCYRLPCSPPRPWSPPPPSRARRPRTAARPVPGPALRPADPGPARPVGRGARQLVPASDLASLRAEATKLRAKLDEQHRRLEVMAEDLGEAYARGVDLLTDAPRLDRRRAAAEKELATVQAVLDERARSSYIAGPGWTVSPWSAPTTRPTPWPGCPCRRPSLRPTWPWSPRSPRPRPSSTATPAPASRTAWSRARGAEQLDAKRAQAERLAIDIERELRTMDRPVAALIEQERRAEETSQRAAFADCMSAARTAGTAPIRDGVAPPRRPARQSPSPWPSSAPPTSGAPRARAPSAARKASPASLSPPPASPSPGSPGPSTPPTPACPSGPSTWSPATWCSTPTTPAARAPSTSRHVHRQGHDGGSSLHRRGRHAPPRSGAQPTPAPSAPPLSTRPGVAAAGSGLLRCCSPCRRRHRPPALNPGRGRRPAPLHAHWNDPRVARAS